MAHILVAEAQVWLESSKTNLGSNLDTGMEASLTAQVLARASLVYDTSTWVDSTSTPYLIRQVIAMKYASWYYQRQYSQDTTQANEYALLLNAQAEQLLQGIIEGTIDLPEVAGQGGTIPYEGPLFYPNNAAGVATDYTYNGLGDNSDGAKFTMGKIW